MTAEEMKKKMSLCCFFLINLEENLSIINKSVKGPHFSWFLLTLKQFLVLIIFC